MLKKGVLETRFLGSKTVDGVVAPHIPWPDRREIVRLCSHRMGYFDTNRIAYCDIRISFSKTQ
jgi:hypothetical protein